MYSRPISAAAASVAAMLSAAVLSPVAAEPTDVMVRVLSHGAKFIGTSMGGVRITLKDVETGEVLARGVVAGGTGDTKKIMGAKRFDQMADDSAAGFKATLDLDRPRLVEVEAFGPLAQAQAAHRVTSSMWLVPGHHVTAGDGWVLNMPGMVVDVLDPPAHVKLGADTKDVRVTANVALMCGCPIEPNGTWPAEDFKVKATILRNGKPSGTVDLAYAGKASQFATTVPVSEPGAYEVLVSAQQVSNGNSGLDRTTFVVEGKPK